MSGLESFLLYCGVAQVLMEQVLASGFLCQHLFSDFQEAVFAQLLPGEGRIYRHCY